MRRPWAFAQRRGGFRGIGGMSAQVLDLSSLGTFTRSTEGSYLTGAPTDGSSAFLAWAGVNTRRIENRGDGLGAMLLMEGSRTNLLLQSRASDNAAWTAGTATTTADQANGPDGAALAERVNAASGQYSNIQSPVIVPASTYAFSAWARAVAGTVSHQISTFTVTDAVRAAALSIGTTYVRRNAVYALASTPGTWIPLDGRDQSARGGQVATAQDCYLDLHQVELGFFPSSPIRTVGASVTRGADVLSYAAGSYPASFLTNGLRFTIAPDASSAELVSSATQFAPIWFGTGAATGVFIGNSGGVKISVWDNNAQKIVSGTVTFSRGQLLTVSINPATGTLIVSGCSSGDGTFTGTTFAWGTTGTGLWIGSRNIGTDPVFGRIGTSIVAL